MISEGIDYKRISSSRVNCSCIVEQQNDWDRAAGPRLVGLSAGEGAATDNSETDSDGEELSVSLSTAGDPRREEQAQRTAPSTRGATGDAASGVVGVTLPLRIAAAVVATKEPFLNPAKQLVTLVLFLQKRDVRTIELVSQAKRLRTEDKLAPQEWNVRSDLLYKGKALYIPRDSVVCAQVMRMYYNDALASHFSKAKTLELILRKYF